jgi:hypothetical protein
MTSFAASESVRLMKGEQSVRSAEKPVRSTSPPFLLGIGLLLGLLVMFALPAGAQESSSENSGTKYGDYNVQQTIEVGVRYTGINGNYDNYDTFVNLGSGARLLDYTLHMESTNHHGLFDSLSLYNFGYGGDPNDLTRLDVRKARLYDFTGTFRRDVNYFGYNLLANPLNPSSFSTPLPVTFAPHGMDLVHRMTDLNLTLMPESRVSFRLGYSRNTASGPTLTTLDSGAYPSLFQNVSTTMNSYRMGIDYKGLPRTTISYDQFLDNFKQDTSVQDTNFGNYQLSNGVPVDLGIVYTGNTPCGSPIATGTSTNPPTATPTCNGFLSYSKVARPRVFLPTEHLSFQSGYVRNLQMAGQISYATAEDTTNDFLELFTGNSTRTLEQASTAGGPTDARRVTVTANWAATYSVTSKFRIVDQFGYDNFRIPGYWNFVQGALFAQTSPASMLNAPGVYTPANCPASNNYAGPGCPVHGSSSGADVANGTDIRFLGQNLRDNTFEMEYDFTKRVGGHIGYRYGARTISDLNQTYYSAEVFYPGPGPAPTDPSLGAKSAQRGDCALQNGALPTGCVAQPDGSIIFSGFTSGSDTARNIVDISENSLLMGIWARPNDSLRLSFDLELFGADQSFTRITPRQLQHYQMHATYNPLKWANLDASINILERRDNVETVNDLEHNRSYNFVTTLIPNEHFSFDMGYNYDDIYSQALVCYAITPAPANPTLCPAALASPVPYQALSFYGAGNHFAYFDVMWKPIHRVTTTLGYNGMFTHGNSLFLNQLTPNGTLSYTYQRPYASVQVDAGKGISYKAAWGYYGYNQKGLQVPTGLAIPATGPDGFLQDFNGNTAMFSLRYSF